MWGILLSQLLHVCPTVLKTELIDAGSVPAHVLEIIYPDDNQPSAHLLSGREAFSLARRDVDM
jgi:hypothetical protein